VKFFLILFNLIALIPLYFNRLYTILIAYFFFKNIKRKINTNKKKLIIVYDFETNNPTFGEYIFYLVLAKFLEIKKKKVEIILITSFTKNSNFNLLSKKKILIFKNEIKKLTFLFLRKNFIEYSDINKFIKDYQNKNQDILFSDFIFKREKFHNYFLQIFNFLLFNEKNNFISKIGLTKNKIEINQKLKKIKPYITWHIRKNNKWGNYNNSKEEILKISNYLKKFKKKHNILILSDENTCRWARKILKNIHNIYYSDIIANGFTECAKALINSDYFFQFKAGGLTHIAYFTNVPYKIISYSNPHDKSFSKKKFLSWQRDDQIRVYNYKKINITNVLNEKL